MILGNRVGIGPRRPDGRVEVELRGHNVGSLSKEIAGLGGALEVEDPPEVRVHLARIGGELVARYAVSGRPDARSFQSER